MKALTWCAPYKVSVENVPDPKILNRRDAIVKVTSTCICGSDLHLYDGYVPFMKPGDILGHEPMGVVEELGPGCGQEPHQNRRSRGGAVSDCLRKLFFLPPPAL
jgi:threonine dehydrogenase-like Zn-dependent dehydrogenase